MRSLIFLAIASIWLSCENNEGLVLQSHDQNAMMTEMHQMMSEMGSITPTNDPDIDFATMMIHHHQGAINMANLELEDGEDSQMRSTAQTIVNDQQQEIQELQSILAGLTPDETDSEFSLEQMASMNKMGKDADVQLITGNTDNDFATLMIVHHQGAMDNASAYLHHGNHSGLSNMAKEMISKQTQEIIDLSIWLIENRR